MIVTATTTFFPKGSRAGMVRTGECFDSDHPMVRAYPHLFAPLEYQGGGGVEQATAGPGEKRAAKRPGRPRKAKPADDGTDTPDVAAEAAGGD